MVLKDERVLLRDFMRQDIEKRLYWETVETEWQLWDGPWEYEGQTEEQRREAAAAAWHSADVAESRAARAEKRTPTFTGR